MSDFAVASNKRYGKTEAMINVHNKWLTKITKQYHNGKITTKEIRKLIKEMDKYIKENQ